MTAPACPEHGPPADPEDRFCEACGRNLRTGEKPAPPSSKPAPPAQPAPSPSTRASPAQPVATRRPGYLSSRAGAGPCTGCGEPVPAGDYCSGCGRRRSTGRDRAELELPGLAAVTDRANRPRNEDAVAIDSTGSAALVVVCDGVSTSNRADVAATLAAEAAIGELRTALAAGVEPAEASRRGARVAVAAVSAAAGPTDRTAPPSCTYVSAIGTADTVTVAWIGDSRAYWIGAVVSGAAPASDAELLTLDDSVRARLAAGRPVPDGLDNPDPDSGALIRWVGADGDGADPQVRTIRPAGPGRIVVCTDGLHRYLPEPDGLAKAVAELPDDPLGVARGLVRLALDAGGHDNIAVAVLPFPLKK